MNFSALLLAAARDAYRRLVQEGAPDLWRSVEVAVFAFMALEALLSEWMFNESANVDPALLATLATVDRLATEERFVEIPRLLYGRTFNRGRSPFQDFHHLKEIRDGLVHYKFGSPPDDALRYLAREGLLTVPRWPAPTVLWVQCIWTREFAKWSYETVCAMASAFLDMLPPDEWHDTHKTPDQINFDPAALT